MDPGAMQADSPRPSRPEEASVMASGSTMAAVLDPQLVDRKATPVAGIDTPMAPPEKEPEPQTFKEGTPMSAPSDWYPAPSHTEEGPSTRRDSPMDAQTYPSLDRPLNVTDALTYLDAVKVQFQDQPDVYNHFLDIMKEFKNEQIDTPGVIQRVSHLFNGHPALIQGFNTFLPVGYRIECSTDPYDAGSITVTTPSGETMKTKTSVGGRALAWSTGPAAAPEPVSSPAPMDPRSYGVDGQAMEPAVQYVQKIKQRCNADTYRQFLDILSRYHHTPDTIDEEEVSKQIAILFKDDPDLRNDFRVFMPDRSQPIVDESASLSHARDREKNRRKLDVVASSMSNNNTALPQKRKRRPAEKEREREQDIPARSAPPAKKPKHAPAQDLTPLSYNPKHVVAAPNSPRRSSHHHPPPPPPPHQPARPMVPHNDETQFFDRVKRALDNRELYNEFLKLVNLFAQDYIDTARLVKEARNFLGNTELFKQFRDILGWDDKKEHDAYLAETALSNWTKPLVKGLPEKPGRIDLSEKYGSYRRIPPAEANVPCSGRDEMCRSVLNDEWVSHPTWTSEDSGFAFHRKNIYEEALHRSEEERHEYDFHIEAIVRTITMLEPINNKINQMSLEDRGNFKLKANFNGGWKAIHQRVIKKIYGREAGMEVVQLMQETPALAIPVVLARLKQKEEEWKRAQREWNKLWRDIDARNYAKSLDHQAISWKIQDKKSLTVKALVNQIETAREEQNAKRAALIDPLFSRTRPRWQMEFEVADESVLQDAVKLIFSFLDRTQGQLNLTERRRIEGFLRTFVPLFFALNTVEFNSAFVVHDFVVDDDGSDAEHVLPNGGAAAAIADDGDALGGSSRAGVSAGSSRGRSRNGAHNALLASSGGDLRKKLLKSEQAKSTSRKTRAQDAASPSVSRFASPAIMGDEKEEGTSFMSSKDKDATGKRSTKIQNVFFTNTTFYVLLRQIQIMYSRLHSFKNLAAKLAEVKTSDIRGSEKGKEPANNGDVNQYEVLLAQCEALYTNEIEQNAFEDQARSVFGTKEAYKIFTLDKVIGAIIKQVQAVIADPKSQELLESLKRERSLSAPTTQDRINQRHQAEKVLGPDENVFRIDWLSESKTMTIQLIGKDDTNVDDTEVLTNRWQAYVDAYVSGETTEGVSQSRMRKPFLQRNLPAAVRETVPNVSSRDGLEIKVCLHTYRLFYVSRTEDFMWKYRSKEEVDKNAQQLRVRNSLRRKWVDAQNANPPPSASTSSASASSSSPPKAAGAAVPPSS